MHCLSRCQGLSTIREGIFGNNELILPGVLNSRLHHLHFFCRVASYLEILLNKKKPQYKVNVTLYLCIFASVKCSFQWPFFQVLSTSIRLMQYFI